ncbi:tRNA dimethylallyltransferase [Alicyclobacillus cellulosilyticus]|uniref:tRNA dimethylallyltransferase n=1 Tax=Alicyclobacillus cellulosilyticus TaxID=1003997 RepID=A0A917K8S6_9BACL|nr:tRNA (adenosine(37)-N6)-dimethylallyltransferase MiaA [Alicyclobacillus cellulosilyticus]GGJ04300.1 tRNA dimethylallyltransferase [Alicyclobacillus cellulosilyticus]
MTADGGTRGPVLCIVGPTATGKSDLGVRIAKAVGGEVVSADSMQVYKGMDIGTAKLTPEQMQGVPHHLIDIVEPSQRFTVAEWVTLADTVIARLHAEGKLPVVVGGTGLYIRAIVEDLDFAASPGSAAVREKWRRFAQQHGPYALHAALHRVDPDAAARLHPHDVRRVIRALEVAELRGQKWSAGYRWAIRGGRYDARQFGLMMPREALYARVEARVDQMMAQGLLEEVRRLLASGVPRDATAMQAIGYKELAAHLAGEMTLAEAVAEIKRATKRFVKRQVAWFRRDPRITWFEVDPVRGMAEEDVARILAEARQMTAGIQRIARE